MLGNRHLRRKVFELDKAAPFVDKNHVVSIQKKGVSPSPSEISNLYSVALRSFIIE